MQRDVPHGVEVGKRHGAIGLEFLRTPRLEGVGEGVGTGVTNEPVQALRLRCGTRHAFDHGKEGATVAVGRKKIHLAQRKPSVA